MEDCACVCGLGSSRGCPCRQEPRGPAADGKPALAEKHLEADAAARCWGGSGGIASPRPPPHCSLQDLPGEMMVEIFASLPGTDLASLAQVCTKFRHILHIDSIWRQRCWEEFGVCENWQNLEAVGTCYRDVYAKLLHPYRHILGLWQRDNELYKTLLYVAVDGLGITGWTYRPRLHAYVDAPMQYDPAFRIRLTERKSTTVECMEVRHGRSHSSHLQIQKDRLRTQCNKTDHLKDLLTRLREEWGQVLVPEDRRRYDCRTYRRLYLPPSHPDNLIKPGLFQYRPYRYGLIAMLSFHGKHARLTEITGSLFQTLQIHLLCRIEMRGGDLFGDVEELSRVVREMEEQVLREQQQKQEDWTEESEGYSPAQPSGGEFGAAPAEEQPVPFVLPEGVSSTDQNYPRTCRMCFYGVRTSTSYAFTESSTGVVTLFDENHLGFIDLQERAFTLFGRVQDTFRNVKAPSPQAFLEMLKTLNPQPRLPPEDI